MVDVNFPFVVWRKQGGFQIRSFALFKLFPVGESSRIEFLIFFYLIFRLKRKLKFLCNSYFV